MHFYLFSKRFESPISPLEARDVSILGTKMAYFVDTNAFERIKLTDEILTMASRLSARRLATIHRFAEQISVIHDVDAIDTFLRWKEHPVLDTILMLVSELDDDDQYEVLNKAEDLINECPIKLVGK